MEQDCPYERAGGTFEKCLQSVLSARSGDHEQSVNMISLYDELVSPGEGDWG